MGVEGATKVRRTFLIEASSESRVYSAPSTVMVLKTRSKRRSRDANRAQHPMQQSPQSTEKRTEDRSSMATTERVCTRHVWGGIALGYTGDSFSLNRAKVLNKICEQVLAN